MKLRNAYLRVGAIAGTAAAAVPALASSGGSGIDYSSITGAVDFGDAAAAIGTIAGAIALVLVAKKGASMVMHMIGR